MNNRFKLNEEEKKHIRTLHKINVINEQNNLSYDEFLEEMLQRGQKLQKLVQVIRKGNSNEMASWDVSTEETALGEFKEVAKFTTDLINGFKPEVKEGLNEEVEKELR